MPLNRGECDRCHKFGYYVSYDEEMEQTVCGKCSNDFADSVEQYEIDKRQRIAESNEY